MKKLYILVIRGTEYLVIGLVGALAILVSVEVFFRYVLNASISWYDEFAGYLLVWVTFWGAVLALDRGRHIGFETLVERFSVLAQKVVQPLNTVENHRSECRMPVVILVGNSTACGVIRRINVDALDLISVPGAE